MTGPGGSQSGRGLGAVLGSRTDPKAEETLHWIGPRAVRTSGARGWRVNYAYITIQHL